MHETKRPLKVFLCHASVDKPKVRELYRYLKRRGIRPWLDEVDLIGGQDWQIEIPKALATSDAIIICLTKNSVDKEGYIQKEIKFALDKALDMPEGRIFLIPVKFEECGIPISLSRYQWVDLSNEAGYSKMMKALKFRASQLERTTVELPKKAVEEENLVLEKAAHQKEKREMAEQVAREKAERETAEKAALQKAGREGAEQLAREKAMLASAEKFNREKERREADEKAAHNKVEHEVVEKTKNEKVEHEVAQKVLRKKNEHDAVGKIGQGSISKEVVPKYKFAIQEEKPVKSSEPKIEKRENKKLNLLPKTGLAIVVGLIGLVVVACIALIGSSFLENIIPNSTSTQVITPFRTPTVTELFLPSPTSPVVLTVLPIENFIPTNTAFPTTTATVFPTTTSTIIPIGTSTPLLNNWSGQPISFDNVDRLIELSKFPIGVASENINTSNIKISHDGTLIAYSLGKSVYTLQVDNGAINTIYEDKYSEIECIDLSSDGNMLVVKTSFREREVKIWDLKNGMLLHSLDNYYIYNCPIFSKDGSMLAFNAWIDGLNNTVIIRTVDKRPLVSLPSLNQNTGQYINQFSPDGAFFITRETQDGYHVGFSLRNSRYLTALRELPKDSSPIFSPDGSLLAMKTSDNTISIQRWPDWVPLPTIKSNSSLYPPLIFMQDNQTIISRNGVVLRQVSDGTFIEKTLFGLNEDFNWIMSGDGSYIAYMFSDSSSSGQVFIFLWGISQ